jgi:hypothetical protein
MALARKLPASAAWSEASNLALALHELHACALPMSLWRTAGGVRYAHSDACHSRQGWLVHAENQ